MKIENIKPEPHLVEEWEFHFSYGPAMAITVDTVLGDTYEFSPTAPMAYFKLTEKPSPVDPDGVIPEEEIFIPLANVICIRKSKRMVEAPSVEEKEAWRQLLNEMVSQPELAN